MFARFAVNENSFRSILKPTPREPPTTWSSFSIDTEPDHIGGFVLHGPRSAAVASTGGGGRIRCLRRQRAALKWPFVMGARAIEPVIAPCAGPWCPYRATADPGTHGETSGRHSRGISRSATQISRPTAPAHRHIHRPRRAPGVDQLNPRHSSIPVTLDVHGYLFEAHDECAAERLGAIFLQTLADSSRTLDRKDSPP